jgi:hypothetical protein
VKDIGKNICIWDDSSGDLRARESVQVEVKSGDLETSEQKKDPESKSHSQNDVAREEMQNVSKLEVAN